MRGHQYYLSPVSAQSLDVLVVRLAKPPLQTPVHCPVSEIFRVKNQSEMALWMSVYFYNVKPLSS